MKLLFDRNLSPRLVNRLVDIYPNSNHIFNIGLDTVEDSIPLLSLSEFKE